MMMMLVRPLVRALLACAAMTLALAAMAPARAQMQEESTSSAEAVEPAQLAPGRDAHSLFSVFFVQRSSGGSVEWIGTGLTWTLLALSAGSIGLLIALARDNRKGSLFPEETWREARRLAGRGEAQSLSERLKLDRSFFAQTLAEGVAEAHDGRAAMLEALERAAEQLLAPRLRRVEALAIVGQVAPMIGLFGTVYGMILAFSEIVASGGSPDPVGLAAGIGTALTTTFWGLVVAIPAMAGAAMLRSTIEGRASEALLAAERVVNRLARSVDDAVEASTAGDR